MRYTIYIKFLDDKYPSSKVECDSVSITDGILKCIYVEDKMCRTMGFPLANIRSYDIWEKEE